MKVESQEQDKTAWRTGCGRLNLVCVSHVEFSIVADDCILLQMNSRQLTNYIKGFAILTVLADHFFGQFLTRYYGLLGDYANGLVAIFFLFSGYGLFFSLKKRFDAGAGGKALSKYFFDRALRIYPLYWLSLYIAPWAFPGDFNVLHSPRGLLIYLGLPFFGAPWLYWFMTALFQCYLLAPLLYFLLRRLGMKLFLAINAGVAMLALPFSVLLPYTRLVDILSYRYFLGAHVVLFALGMALPTLVETFEKKVTKSMFAASLAAFFLTVFFTRTEDDVFNRSHIAFIPLMILTTFALGLTWLCARPPLPLKRGFVTLGRHSYPVYLFHIPYYALLWWLGLLKDNDPKSILIIIVLLPIFFFLCIKIERGLNASAALGMAALKRCRRSEKPCVRRRKAAQFHGRSQSLSH